MVGEMALEYVNELEKFDEKLGELLSLLKEEKDVKVKAAGGIATLDDAEKFISLGTERLGTSRLIKIIQNADNGFGY